MFHKHFLSWFLNHRNQSIHSYLSSRNMFFSHIQCNTTSGNLLISSMMRGIHFRNMKSSRVPSNRMNCRHKKKMCIHAHILYQHFLVSVRGWPNNASSKTTQSNHPMNYDASNCFTYKRWQLLLGTWVQYTQPCKQKVQIYWWSCIVVSYVI